MRVPRLLLLHRRWYLVATMWITAGAHVRLSEGERGIGPWATLRAVPAVRVCVRERESRVGEGEGRERS